MWKQTVLYLWSLVLLAPSSASAWSPLPADRRGESVEETKRKEAEEEARQYRAEVTELAKDIARKRAERLAWLYFPAEVQWVGVALYYGNGWQLRPPCEAGRQCLPHMDVLYGVEVFVNPFASLDIVGRIGGAAQISDGFGTRHGLDASALLRWRIVGVVPVSVGWRIVGTPYQQIADGAVADTTAYTQYAHLDVGFRFRGATASLGVDLGLHRVLAVKSSEDAVSAFSGIATLRLTTPAVLGF